MLCNECHRHFDFSSQNYASIKKSTISELQAHHASPALLGYLKSDFHIYQASKHHGQLDACPWVSSQVVSSYLTGTARAALICHELEIWQQRAYGTPRRNLQHTANEGCDMCLRICEALECLRFEVELADLESWLVLEPVTLRPLEIKFLVEHDNLESQWLRFKVLEEASQLGRQFKDSRGIYTDHRMLARRAPDSDAVSFTSNLCLDELITCMSECANKHRECRKGATLDWIPSRLIDIERVKSEGEIRLVLRDEMDPARTQPRYTTLSHIWGSQKFLTLTTSNIRELRAGFSIVRLPKKFQEAIAVTEKSGLRYIWIDSLW
jgi:hypothetical protein